MSWVYWEPKSRMTMVEVSTEWIVNGDGGQSGSRRGTAEEMVRPRRFELLTYSFGGCRSIQLSYGRIGLSLAWSGAEAQVRCLTGGAGGGEHRRGEVSMRTDASGGWRGGKQLVCVALLTAACSAGVAQMGAAGSGAAAGPTAAAGPDAPLPSPPATASVTLGGGTADIR
jgi:hypothetical protein